MKRKSKPHVWVIESWQRSGHKMKGPYHWDVADYRNPSFSTKRLAEAQKLLDYGRVSPLTMRVAKYVREK